jgi:antitoxin (DNA-binding transcriptional repressor) of toxin-antitoxin stability system
LLDEVRDSGTEVIITKRGKPVARLLPIGGQGRSLRGAWKGLARIRGDIVHVDCSADFEASR